MNIMNYVIHKKKTSYLLKFMYNICYIACLSVLKKQHSLISNFISLLQATTNITFLLRNLYVSQEATVRTGHGTTDWFQIGKGVPQGCMLSPCLFNFYAEYIMRNAGLEEAQAGSKIAGRNINNLNMQITPPLWQKVRN